MKKVNQELYELGYRIKPTLHQKIGAKIVMKERKRK